MENLNGKMNFEEVKHLLYDINPLQLRKIFEQYQVIGEKKGRYTYYDAQKIMHIKTLMESRYEFNKKNHLIKSQIVKLGIKKQDINELTSIEVEAIDRIHEFKGALSFYLREETELLIHQRNQKKRLLNLEQIIEELDLSHFKQVKEVLNYYGLKGKKIRNSSLTFYDPLEINKIKKHLADNYKSNCENFLHHQEILEMGCNKNDIAIFNAIKSKAIDRIGKFKNCGFFFEKKEVLERLNGRKLDYETYTTSEVCELLDLSLVNTARYLKRLNITSIKVYGDLQNHWNKHQIDEVIKKKNELFNLYSENFVTIKEFEKITGISIQRIKRIYQKKNQKISFYQVPLEARLYHFSKANTVVARLDIMDFFNNIENELALEPTEKRELKKIFNSLLTLNSRKASKQSLNRIALENKIDSYEEFKNYINYSSDDFKVQMDRYGDSAYEIGIKKYIISQADILKKYDISYSNFFKLRNEHINNLNYISYQNIFYYSLKDINNLFENLLIQQQELLENYLTSFQAEEVGATNFFIKKVKKKNVPSELKFGIMRKVSYLYNKIETFEVIKNKKQQEVINNYKSQIKNTLLPSELLKNLIEELHTLYGGYKLDIHFKHTELLWLNFIKDKIDSSKGNTKTISSLLTKLISLTVEFYKMINLKKKNITEWQSNEINSVIMSSSISPYQRAIISNFLNIISIKNAVNYNPGEFIDIYKVIETSKVPRDEKTYDIETFIDLIDYVSDIELHKKEAVEHFGRPTNGVAKYNEYESVWLYILIHLNNAWRSTDVIEKVPRITLPKNICSIEDYKKHNITNEEADIIIWELAGKLLGVQHNKNKKDAYYFCSEELKLPLANSLVLCELKCQLERPLNNNLIKLTDDNALNSTLNKSFFKNFKIKEFVFESLAANRSFVTLVNLVLKKRTNRNPLEISRFLRNHSSLDVTDIYVEISEDHLNKLSKEIFNKGFFGYTYDFLLKSIIEIDINEKMGSHSNLGLLKSIFGDVYKIENLASSMNEIDEKNLSLIEYTNSLTIEKQAELITLISLEQLPAKQQHWQCILGNCLYLERNCEACPFSIPHLYVLIEVTKKLNKLLDEYEETIAGQLDGEKARLINLLYLYLPILADAKKKFGEHVVEAFLGYDYSLFKSKISDLKVFYEYLTLEKKGR